jgi:hypothetical protein
MQAFEQASWAVGMKVLSCFADRLGFERDFFTRAHDMGRDTYQSTLRLLHYYAIPADVQDKLDYVRGGAHTDFNCLTMLYQREGQGGLQVCPGKEYEAQEWTSVPPQEDRITCNIGDMLMRWSDDRLLSNFHRVRNPLPGEYMGAALQHRVLLPGQHRCDDRVQPGQVPTHHGRRLSGRAHEGQLRAGMMRLSGLCRSIVTRAAVWGTLPEPSRGVGAAEKTAKAFSRNLRHSRERGSP